ncbi:MAG: bi-domain-containing oxidoreductase [Candidatus Hodarchaeota archaeon]
MKQVLISKGAVFVDDVPAPMVTDNCILVKTRYSLISTGTEISGIESTGGSIIQKAINRPEKVKKVIDKVVSQGIRDAYNFVKEQLGTTLGTGYSCSGVVIDVGKNIKDIKIGDRVACAGSNHAEIVCVPGNLTTIVPENVDFDEAAFIAVGAIAIQGVRRADVRFGETVAVIGLGLIGQITVQILKIAGCRVIGIDIDNFRIDMALDFGCDTGFNADSEVINKVMNQTNGTGVDSVLICARTSSNTPVEQALSMTRKRGKVVVVGAVGMNLPRRDFYAKELDFLISTSYGPGRYDDNYEQKGLDYPIGYVRWTENRNMQEFLRLLSEKKLDVKTLVNETFLIEEAQNAYKFLQDPSKNPLAILLKFHDLDSVKIKSRKVNVVPKIIDKEKINAAIIGGGGFAKNFHLPNLSKIENYRIVAIVDKLGIVAKQLAKQYKAGYATTDYQEVLKDDKVDMVVITTRHNLHAEIAINSAKAGKAILMEKPMAMNQQQLDELVKVLQKTGVPFMVGFNRRFSPFVTKIKEQLKNRQNPMVINYRVNSGYFQPDHWIYSDEGGGRIIGECCHFFDLFNFFADSESCDISAFFLEPWTKNFSKTDNFITNIKYGDGSIANLIYTSLGNKAFPKERIEIFAENKVFVIDDFKKLTISGPKEKGFKLKIMNKGHFEELVEFAKALRSGNNFLIPLEQLISATEISFKINKMLTGVHEDNISYEHDFQKFC